MADIEHFWLSLFYWFSLNKRDFPWRRTNNAYHILIAEILLQQTHVRKVEAVYNFVQKAYPTPRHLMQADPGMLSNIIEPIGLVYRAERLIKIAEILYSKYNELVPNEKKVLLSLPGVGDYIADAVLCYAYKHPTVPIDTNVIRLFCRYFGLATSKVRARNDKLLADDIRSLYLFYSTKTANLAVLDFASAVCRARSYNCNGCILCRSCKHAR